MFLLCTAAHGFMTRSMTVLMQMIPHRSRLKYRRANNVDDERMLRQSCVFDFWTYYWWIYLVIIIVREEEYIARCVLHCLCPQSHTRGITLLFANQVSAFCTLLITYTLRWGELSLLLFVTLLNKNLAKMITMAGDLHHHPRMKGVSHAAALEKIIAPIWQSRGIGKKKKITRSFTRHKKRRHFRDTIWVDDGLIFSSTPSQIQDLALWHSWSLPVQSSSFT